MTPFEHIQLICNDCARPWGADGLRYALKKGKVIHKVINFKTQLEAYQPHIFSDKTIIIPLRPTMKKFISHNCILCYTL